MFALRELGSVWRYQQRKMRKLWWLCPCSFEDQNMLEGIGEMVLSTDDMAYMKVDIVSTGCQVVSRHAIAAQQSEVFDIGSGFCLLAINRIGKLNVLPFFSDRKSTRLNSSHGYI